MLSGETLLTQLNANGVVSSELTANKSDSLPAEVSVAILRRSKTPVFACQC